MKKIFFILLLIFSNFTYSQQTDPLWNKIIEFEVEGKVKSADSIIIILYEKARINQDDAELIKCFFHQSKYTVVLEEDAQEKIINRLLFEREKTKSIATKAILEYIYAINLKEIYYKNSYNLRNRTAIDTSESSSFLTWSGAQYQKEIDNAFQRSISNMEVLNKTPLRNYQKIIEFGTYSKNYNRNLLDFLAEMYIENYPLQFSIEEQEILTSDQSNKLLYANTANFLTYKCPLSSLQNFQKLIVIYQNLEDFYSKQNDEYTLSTIILKRLKLIDNSVRNYENYHEALKYFYNSWEKEENKLKANLVQLELLEKFADRFKNNNKETIVAFCDTIIQKKLPFEIINEFADLRNKMLSKEVNIQFNSKSYPNQPILSKVNYKNVDTLYLKVYRINSSILRILEKNKSDKSSTISTIIQNKKSEKELSYYLPSPRKHYYYSTEIIFPGLENGHYIVVASEESNIDFKEELNYNVIEISDISYYEYTINDSQYFHVIHKKNGAPALNATVERNKMKKVTNINGVVEFTEKTKQQDNELLVATPKDTLLHFYKDYNYSNSEKKVKNRKKDKNSEDEFDATSFVYLDRGIYRLGQKMFFKGIVTQKKNNVSSVVPNLWVTVYIDDPSKEIAKFRLQTNKFGSVSGEFVIPKSGQTGSYDIYIDEDEDYENDKKYNKHRDEHPFWDIVDFDYRNTTFQVEEYKRPTFEITFELIKENYYLNDSLVVSGIAKSFSGSKITDAKVSYSIKRNSKFTTYNSYYTDNNKIIATGETKTDASGNFKIHFKATPFEGYKKEDHALFIYTIETTITDITGETQVNTKSVNVADYCIDLEVLTAKEWKANDDNIIYFNSKNLNGQTIFTNGIIEIYKLEKINYPQRVWSEPDIQTIPENQFNLLFPNIPYKSLEYIGEEKLGEKVFSQTINTEIDTEIKVKDANLFDVGTYKIIFKASDNSIEREASTTFKFVKENQKGRETDEPIEYSIANSKTMHTDGFVDLTISSCFKDAHITVTSLCIDKIHFSTLVALENGEKSVRIPLNKKTADQNIEFELIYDTNEYEEHFSINNLPKNNELFFEIASFRNQLKPNDPENWSFIIHEALGKNSSKEVLATMYDSSLDQFASSYWQNSIIEKNRTYNYKIIEKEFYDSNFKSINLKNLRNANDFFRIKKKDQLQKFGFSINSTQFNTSFYRRLYTEKSKNIAGNIITGYVFEGEYPLPGASVNVEGTDRGTQTDFEGFFSIYATPGQELKFQYIGLKTLTIVVGDKKNIIVELEEGPEILGEVVLLGYTTEITKAYSISAKLGVLNEYNYTASLDQVLSGQVAGANIKVGSGQSGSSGTILIRGRNSLISDTEPLFIIDGIPLSEAEFRIIEASNIATIEVLKDAAATALYGSRGSGGVIIMTTKKGIEEVEKVQTRKNFDETAFFFPHLTTDKKGMVSFSFTSPEALTKWKLRLFAHNKKGVSGFYENTAVTKKELMIVPNFPRYFREKDSITITAKISNLTGETKNGLALLQLFNAVTMEPIDSFANNKYATQAINVAPKGNNIAAWKIYIPENIEAIQYKIVAKAGNYSDGEENIVPVFKNTILVTESIPIWVRENSSKTFTLDNLKNNTSTTLKNHQLTLEYTSNPTWLAIQSLPYLMEFEHECSEQTFAKYFSNVLAKELLISNPKIKAVFENWKNNVTPISKLNQNEELKSILLSETPWLLDAENEEIQKKNLALLFDSEKLATSTNQLLEKLSKKQLPSGGFPWFDGGEENEFITKHITIGIGYLSKLAPNSVEINKLETISKNSIGFLDANFLEKNKTKISNSKTLWKNNYNELHYVYARSFYLNLYPPSDSLKKAINYYVNETKSNWSGFSLYEKGLAALVLNRFGDVNNAKLIVESIKQTASNQTESGMYWIENKSGWNWYQSPIETQALLIEVFDEIAKDQKSIDLMKVWLLKNRQTRNWPTTKATTTAIYSLLQFGNNWTNQEVDSKITLGNNQLLDKKITNTKTESLSGYLKLNFKESEIDASLATLKIENSSSIPGYGGLYWQYFEDLDKIKSSQEDILMLYKELYIKNTSITGTHLSKIDSTTALKLGDLITIRIIITSKETMEYVHLKDMRAAGFEPIYIQSSYKYQDGLNYYISTRDAVTHFFFDTIKKGTYVLEYDVRVNHSGSFIDGISTIQSMYAPEFSAHSNSTKIKID